MIRTALKRALGAEMIGVRITTAAFTPGTEGKKGKTVFFPDHADSRIMIGVEATRLLVAARRGPVLRVVLGEPPGLPVTLEIPCPEAPRYALAAMRKVPDCSPFRFRPPGAAPTTREIVLGYVGAGVDLHQTGGHLPAGWLSEKPVNSAADKAWALRDHHGASGPPQKGRRRPGVPVHHVPDGGGGGGLLRRRPSPRSFWGR